MADEKPENTVGELPAAGPAQEVDAASQLAAALASAGEVAVGLEIGATAAAGPADIDLSHLPLHTRSLLRIPVTVTVTLARQRRPIDEIIELGPGTIVKFDKTYDEPLELSVGELPIAAGEVVKIGDKFGLRISRIIRPHERFASVG